MSTTTGSAHFETVTCQGIPSPDVSRTRELANIVAILVKTFQPECIYVFGSHGRGDATRDSGVDLLVIVPEANEPGHHRDQEAY